MTVCFALVSSYPFILPLSMMISPTNWNTSKPYKREKSKPRTVYTVECEDFVAGKLQYAPRSGTYGIGYYDEGKPVSSTGKRSEDL